MLLHSPACHIPCASSECSVPSQEVTSACLCVPLQRPSAWLAWGPFFTGTGALSAQVSWEGLKAYDYVQCIAYILALSPDRPA